MIRTARSEDAEAMARLNVEAGRAAWGDFIDVSQLQPRVEWYAENLDSALAAFVAEEDGEVVGFAVAREEGLLDTLYTAPRVWGRGLGRSLIDRALAALREAGHDRAVLWTAEGNTRAREIYERYGWQLDGATREKTFAGATFTELRYSTELQLDPYTLPEGLPEPVDDGTADHLPGLAVPSVVLASTQGELDLADLCAGLGVLYVYPRTGKPGVPSLPGWDDFPGARGCTPQSCGFRDHAAELAGFGARVAGLSSQSLDDQLEFAERTHMPFPVCADPELRAAEALGLPTFELLGHRLYKRLALIAVAGRIEQVFYPVFPPDRNAGDVVAWLAARS